MYLVKKQNKVINLYLPSINSIEKTCSFDDKTSLTKWLRHSLVLTVSTNCL